MGGVKDTAAVVLALSLLLGGLFLYTGVWPPAVIVESGSMMHDDSAVRYGRFGTIDPGDLVLVRAVDEPTDVTTWADSADHAYGDAGDVIVYHRNGNAAVTPIIHRAMAWVDVTPGPRYEVRWHPEAPCPATATRTADGAACAWGGNGITVAAWGMHNYRPDASGFITKGDNPETNTRADQAIGLTRMVRPEWVIGEARGEIPWLGLAKLALAPRLNQEGAPGEWVQVGNAVAPKDLWVMLGLSVVTLVGTPVLVDYATSRAATRRARE